MKGRFKEQIRDIYKKTAIRVRVVLPSLARASASVLRESIQIVLPCAAVLLLFEVLQGFESAAPLIELVKLLLVLPAVCAATIYAADASWERRSVTLRDAVHLVRIRIKQVLITGAAAWLIVMAAHGLLNMALTLIVMLLGSIFALLSMIPIIGVVFTVIGVAAQWLVALFVDYACHVALTMGMLALIADGISGKPQLDRVMNVMKNGGKKLWEAFILLFGVWVVIGGAGALLTLAVPMMDSVITALLTVCSTAAVSVIYLREREGVDFR